MAGLLVAVLGTAGSVAAAEARGAPLGLDLVAGQGADASGDARRALARLGIAPRQLDGLTLRVTPSKPSYGPLQTLVAGVDVDNAAAGGLADFYLGAVLPDGLTVVSLGLGQVLSVGSLADLRSLTPAVRSVPLDTPFRFSEVSLFQHLFTGGEPVGAYLLFLGATTPGALDDGALGPGELLALTTQAFRFDPGGLLLVGDPATPAVSATLDLDVIDGVAASEIETDEEGARWARTLIELGFVPDATVGQVNALLQGIDGRIVSMLEGVLLAVVQIPDPGGLGALDALLARLRADAIVRLATRTGFDEPTLLPDNIVPSTAQLLDHHMAVRAPAAWNTRAALGASGTAEPLVLIPDFFGGGPPGSDFDVNDIHIDYGIAGTNQHGYHVLGIVAGTFGGPGTSAGEVTGLYPGTVRLRVIDLSDHMPDAPRDNRIVQLARLTSGNVVVSTSLGPQCDTPDLELLTCSSLAATGRAVSWLEKLRLGAVTVAGSGLEGRVLNVSAAGNLLFPGGTQDARLGTGFSSARLLSGLTTFFGTPVPNATNTLVIENRTNQSTGPLGAGCLNSSSWRGGDLSAIGTNVFSMTAPVDLIGFLSGTSMATPQAAALAAWVWTLRPAFTPQAVMSVLQRTARPADLGCVDPLSGAPVIDAYAAVLATDQGFADAPVRRALLDVVDGAGHLGQDGRFDEGDLGRFLVELDSASGSSLDFSRFDLNGDGRTGGAGTEAVDLDMDGLIFTVSLVTPEGSGTLNESAVRDIDVLCFYAFSVLFQGSGPARDQLLAGRCPTTATPVVRASQQSILIRVFQGGVQVDQRLGPTDPLVSFVETVSHASGGGTVSAQSVFDTVVTNPSGGSLTGGNISGRVPCTGATDLTSFLEGEYAQTLIIEVEVGGGSLTVTGTISGSGNGAGFAAVRLFEGSQERLALESDDVLPFQGPRSASMTVALVPGSYQLELVGSASCGKILPVEATSFTTEVGAFLTVSP